jgi:hypothetical protein
MTFHPYSLINAIFIAFLSQEIKLYKNNYKRKSRLIVFSVFSVITFVGVILYDLLVLKSVATFIYELFLSGLMFFIMSKRSVEKYKVMKRANKKKEVKKLNLVFYIVTFFIMLLPFIIIGITALITKNGEFFFESHILPYLLLGLLLYVFLALFVIYAFAKKYYMHYQNQLLEDKQLAEQNAENETNAKDRRSNENLSEN